MSAMSIRGLRLEIEEAVFHPFWELWWRLTTNLPDRVDFAMDRVAIVFSMGAKTGGELRWVVWDQNLDSNKRGLGWVYIGPVANQEADKLDKPPGEVYWAHRKAVAKAAIREVRWPL